MKSLQIVFLGALSVAMHVAAQPSQRHEHAGRPPITAPSGDTSFQGAMIDAMRRMDEGMAIAHSGNPDRDFAAMMIPHHQGAIDMARAELQFGQDPVLRRLAQAIIVEQQQEIEVMGRQLDRLPAAQSDRGSEPENLSHHDSRKE